VGVGVGGGCVSPTPHTPKTQIPNPQSPLKSKVYNNFNNILL